MAQKKRRAAGDPAVAREVQNGRELPARVPGKNPATGQEQGQLVRHPEGSNGGVSRGPDLKPRNVVQAVLLKALSDEGHVVTGDGTGPKVHWRKKKKVRHAMMHNAARAMQRIFEDAAAGDQAAYGPSIKALSMMHDVMQPGKDEAKGGGVPFGPRFTRPPQQPPVSSEATAEQPVFVDETGQGYVDGDA